MDTISLTEVTKPILSQYDYAVWPGDTVDKVACSLRALVRAWESGVRWNDTIIISSDRLLSDQENYEECCKAILVSPEDQKADLSWKTLKPKTESEMMNWIWFNFDDPTRGRHVLGGQYQEFFLYKHPITMHELYTLQPKRSGSVLLSWSAPSETTYNEKFYQKLTLLGFTVETLGI